MDGELLGARLVPGEGNRDVDRVGCGEAIGRAEVGERVIGRRLGSSGEDANEPGHCRARLAAFGAAAGRGPPALTRIAFESLLRVQGPVIRA